MNERLLQFIWQFRHYNTSQLELEGGGALHVIFPGEFNQNQGPDFLHAKIEIDGILIAGHIELHVRASDWKRHKHSADKNYSNIILHVVWEYDEPVEDGSGIILPTLVIQNRVSKILLGKYQSLVENESFVPCSDHLPVLDEFKWTAWKDRMAVERLQQKAGKISNLLTDANNHWEEVFWWLIAGNFGIKVNAEPFESIARSIPINVIGRHKNQIHQLEALLLGQAGLLEGTFNEQYPAMLQKEYAFLHKKYGLKPISKKPDFLRMRPANFPTIRLAQLAMLLHHSVHLFSKVIEMDSLDEIKSLINTTPNDYWNYHYLFDEETGFKLKPLGRQMIDNIVINTIVPVLFAYGCSTSRQEIKDKSMQWLEQIKPEKNSIIAGWEKFGINSASALQTQGLLQLKNNYCNVKRCLECAVGNAILRSKVGG